MSGIEGSGEAGGGGIGNGPFSITAGTGTLSLGITNDFEFSGVPGVDYTDVNFGVVNTSDTLDAVSQFGLTTAQGSGNESNNLLMAIRAGDNMSTRLAGAPARGGTIFQASALIADDNNLVFGNIDNAVFMLDGYSNVVSGMKAAAAADTNGFFYIPLLVGNQTGVPAKLTGVYSLSAPVRLQNNGSVYSLRAYINGGWRSVALV